MSKTRYITLTKGLFAAVDDADYERVSKYKWCAVDCGRARKLWYAWSSKVGYMHRFITGMTNGGVTDHIDRNGLNNKRENLREVTQQQNCWNNTPVRNKSGYKGVYWDAVQKKWKAQIRHEYKMITIGRYKNIYDAAKAFEDAVVQLRGEEYGK